MSSHRISTNSSAIVVALVVAIVCSCSKFQNNFYSDFRILIMSACSNQEKTKASSTVIGRTYPLGDGLQLEEFVSDYGFEPCEQTKGAIITTNGNNKINENGRSFNIEGWLGPNITTSGYKPSEEDKTNRHFMSDAPTYDGSSWNMAAKHLWRNGISTTFWSYYVPEGGTVPVFSWPGATPTDPELNTLNFTYTLPAPAGKDNDAYNSKDFLIAYNKEKRTINENGTLEMTSGTGVSTKENSIGIHFYHPLSAIKFLVGDISGESTPGANEYVNITKVELVKVKTSGSFTATGSAPNGCAVTCTSTSGSATYSQTASRAEIEGGKFTDAASEFVFFMIPQDLSEVTVRLTMVRKKKTVTYGSDGIAILSSTYGDDIIFTREVNLTGTWEPGKYYTYKINSTVYFGGEEVTLEPDFEHSDNIS